MKVKEFFTGNLFLRIIFILSIFLLLFISAISYRNTLSLINSVKWLVHTQKVKNELQQLHLTLLTAESCQRGFLITKDSSYLNAIRYEEKANEILAKLERITTDNEQQQLNMGELRKVVDDRILQLKRTLVIATDQNYTPQEFINSLSLGKWHMSQIAASMHRMIQLEDKLLRERQSEYDNTISISPLYTVLVVILSLLVFILAYKKISKDVRRLKIANRQLQIFNETIDSAEIIGSFSTWHCDYRVNKVTFSKNQYYMLGLNPTEKDLTLKDLIEFVHPDDVDMFKRHLKIMFEDKEQVDFLYRMIRADKAVHYYRLTGKVVRDHSGNEIFLGINKDKTEQQNYSHLLEERNRELEQSNKELASFNHIASHDLQEPLRKIQTFISRIESDDDEGQKKMYFKRIKASAERMRKLIDDLLLFSRASKSDNVFETADLNEILINAKIELIQAIEEKKAVIQSEKLPVMRVIPFQVQQLFTNIIGNAIKYSKSDGSPVISIASKQITIMDSKHQHLREGITYQLISINDNGIGFDTKYAHDIFNLFYRLNPTDEQQGTGIGLAICKRIAENHHGYIEANSTIGQGSTFNIYLPV